jgi:hypothetical protein
MKSIILALVLAVSGISGLVIMAATQAQADNAAPQPKG